MKHVIVCLSVLTLSACASGIDGFDQSVQFDSTPAAASVSVVQIYRGDVPAAKTCATPCSLVLGRDRTYQATFSKEGCQSVDLRVYPTHDSRFFVPIFPDAWTGRTYDLKPDPTNAKLTCASTGG